MLWLGGSTVIVGAVLLPLIPGGWPSILALLAAYVVPIVALVRGFNRIAYPSAVTRLFVYRPFWYAMLGIPILAIAATIGLIGGAPFGASRLGGVWSIGVTTLIGSVAALAGFAGSRRLVTRNLVVKLQRWPESFQNLRIVQISDLHVGPQTSRRHLQRVVDAVKKAKPDLIVITGDQVDDFGPDILHFATAFKDLSAPLGVFAIAGNHDVYAGWPAVSDGLNDMGIVVLVNDATPLVRGDERIWIAGTGDPAGRGRIPAGDIIAAPDIDRTLRSVPDTASVIALAHNPALWDELAHRGVDLTLSGHTHYGQFAIPRLGWNLASPFASVSMGWHRLEDSLLYINPGTNFWGIPFRLGTPPEVTVLDLSRCDDNCEPSISSVQS